MLRDAYPPYPKTYHQESLNINKYNSDLKGMRVIVDFDHSCKIPKIKTKIIFITLSIFIILFKIKKKKICEYFVFYIHYILVKKIFIFFIEIFLFMEILLLLR